MEAKKLKEEVLRRLENLPEDQLPKVVSLLEKLDVEARSKKKYSEAINKVWGSLTDLNSSSEDFAARKKAEKSLEK